MHLEGRESRIDEEMNIVVKSICFSLCRLANQVDESQRLHGSDDFSKISISIEVLANFNLQQSRILQVKILVMSKRDPTKNPREIITHK